MIDPMFDRHYDFSPYVYVLNNPIDKIDLYGLTDWSTVKKGIITTGIGLGSTIGGIAAVCTPTGVGQIGGGILISTGIPSIGLGIAIVADGIKNDGANNYPGGVNEALGMGLDKFIGNENNELRKVGSFVDIVTNFAAGAPTAIEMVGIGVLTIDALAGSDNSTTTTTSSSATSTEMSTSAVRDNTSVASAPVPEIDLRKLREDEE